jgi:hypothetical protein
MFREAKPGTAKDKYDNMVPVHLARQLFYRVHLDLVHSLTI